MPQQNKHKYYSRWIAYKVIHITLTQKQKLEKSLNIVKEFSKLSQQDKALCYQLILTFFRYARLYIPILNQFSKTKIKEPLSKGNIILLLGAVQLGEMAQSPHAVVDAAVEIAKSEGMERPAKYINAILRRLMREKKISTDVRDFFPRWLRNKLEKVYSNDVLIEMAKAYLQQPKIDLYVKSRPDEWAQKLNAKQLQGQSLRLAEAVSVPLLPGYDNGKWWVQSVMAATAVGLLGNVRGKSVLDLCAAPGGKTLALCQQGAQVTALDDSPARLLRLMQNLSRTKFTAKVISADILKWETAEKFEKVVLDVPCSATGVLHHHPDILWIRDHKEIKKIVQLQKYLLQKTSEFVTIGGEILYCTCSILPEEGRKVILDFLAKNKKFKLIPILKDEMQALDITITKEGFVQSLPHMKPDWGPITGFFAARLKKSI